MFSPAPTLHMCKLGHGICCSEQDIISERQTCLPSLPHGLPFSVLISFGMSFTPFTVGEKLRVFRPTQCRQNVCQPGCQESRNWVTVVVMVKKMVMAVMVMMVVMVKMAVVSWC